MSDASPARPSLSLCQLAFPDTTLREDIALCRRLGYDGISIDEKKLDREGAVSPGEFFESGLRAAVCAPRVLTVLPTPDTPESADLDVRLDELLAGIERLAAFEPTHVMVCTGPADTAEDRATLRRMMQRAQTVARDAGTVLAVEPMRADTHSSWTFLHDLYSTADFFSSLPAPVPLVFDTWHMWDSARVLHGLADFAPSLAAVQVCDYRTPRAKRDRLMPGDGWAGIRQMFSILAERGYAGWLDIEIFSTELWQLPPEQFLRRAAAGTWACWDDSLLIAGIAATGAVQ